MSIALKPCSRMCHTGYEQQGPRAVQMYVQQAPQLFGNAISAAGAGCSITQAQRWCCRYVCGRFGHWHDPTPRERMS